MKVDIGFELSLIGSCKPIEGARDYIRQVPDHLTRPAPPGVKHDVRQLFDVHQGRAFQDGTSMFPVTRSDMTPLLAVEVVVGQWRPQSLLGRVAFSAAAGAVGIPCSRYRPGPCLYVWNFTTCCVNFKHLISVEPSSVPTKASVKHGMAHAPLADQALCAGMR